jgi:uncharacterized membrane protein YfcA
MTTFRGFEQAFLTAIVLEVVVGMMMAYQHRRTLRMREAAWLKVCGVAGVLGGSVVRSWFSLTSIVVAAMAMVIAACALRLAQPKKRLPRSRRLLTVAGIASGALNSWTSLSGPPVVIYYLATEDNDEEVRGNLSGYFVLLYVVTLFVLVIDGSFDKFDNGWVLSAGLATVVFGQRPARKIGDALPGSLENVSLIVLILAALATAVSQLA